MYYFASDMHLGSGCGDPRRREKLLVRWLEEVSADAEAIFLVGDVFDFWFEYKRVVPQGFTRLLGKLSELTDRGVTIHFFVGNHDMWVYDYLSRECGLVLHTVPEVFELAGRRVLVAHGDNMGGENSWLERLMVWVFHSRGLRAIFSALVHPDLAMRFGHWWSGKSRKTKSISHPFRGEEEWLVRWARKRLQTERIDYFVFGHIHCAENYDLGGESRVLFLGEWIEHPSYAALDREGKMELVSYCNNRNNQDNYGVVCNSI